MKLLTTSTYRVTMGDVDAARVIYYAAPYRWSEALFTNWLAVNGHAVSTMLETGLGSPCVASSAEYRSPLRLDDLVRLDLRSGRVGTSSFQIVMDAFDSSERVAVRTDSTFVMTASTGGVMRSVALPPALRELLHQPRS